MTTTFNIEEIEIELDSEFVQVIEKKNEEVDNKIVDKVIEKVLPQIPIPENGKDGKNGVTPTKKELKEIMKPLIPDEKEIIKKVIDKIPKPKDGEKGDKGEDGKTLKFSDLTPYEKQVLTGPQGSNGVGIPRGGTSGQKLVKSSSKDFDTEWTNDTADTDVWGSITGTLSDQTDLQTALDDKVPYTGATSDVNIGAHTLIAHSLKGDASDGVLIEANNGTDIGLLGAGNTANVTWYGNHNFDTSTADTIASFGSSKTLQSLSTSTYPSLTELSYVKGVTSAIQTQLNNLSSSIPVGANPTATIGLTAVNGSASTFLRSDSAPALSQAIVPTWTGKHIFKGAGTTTGINLEYQDSASATRFTLADNGNMFLGSTGNILYTDTIGRLDIIRGGSQITSGLLDGTLGVFSSTYGGNSNAGIAIVGRTVGGASAHSFLSFGHFLDPDEASLKYFYDTDTMSMYLGGGGNPVFSFKGGSEPAPQFGWGYYGTPPTNSKLFLGLAGADDPRYIDLQTGSYGIWNSKLGWYVINNGGTRTFGVLNQSNTVNGVSDVNISTTLGNRFGWNQSTKISTFSITNAADQLSIGTTVANAATTITGVGTRFTKELAIGDRISLSSAASTYGVVTAIANDTSLTVDTALGNGTSQTINIKHGIFKISDASSAQKFFVDDEGNTSIGYDRSNLMKITSGSTGSITFDAIGSGASFTFSDAVTINGSLTLSAQNIVTDTTTGMKIGTATTQKLGFFNSTPIVQPANTVAIDTTLVNLGLRASGGNASFDTAIVNNLPIRLKGYTVAGLPAGTIGDTAYITDGTTVPAKGVAPVGGGTSVGVVFYDGSAWVGI